MSYEDIVSTIKSRDYYKLRTFKNPNVTDTDGNTPLMYSVLNNDKKAVKVLLLNGADPDYLNPVETAVKRNFGDIVGILIDYGADVTDPNLLLEAVKNKNPEITRLILENTKAPDLESFRELVTNWGNLRIMKMFLGYNNNLMYDPEILNTIMDKRDTNTMKLFFDYGLDPNVQTDKGSLIMQAIKNRDAHMVNLLSDNGIDFSTTENNNVPLTLATERGESKIVFVLLEKGAQVDEIRPDGKNALFIAVEKNNVPLIELLLDYGAEFTLPVELTGRETNAIAESWIINPKIFELFLNREKQNLKPDEYLQFVDEINDDLNFYISDVDQKCDATKFLIRYFGLDLDNTLVYLQGKTPKPICRDLTLKSKRARLPKTQVRALGKTLIQTQPVTQKHILDKFIDTPTCFCLIHPFGIFDNLYTPVIRFGRSETEGFYGDQPIDNPDFTWYYLEPEIGIYLYAPRTLVTKNKITAVIELEKLQPIGDSVSKLKAGLVSDLTESKLSEYLGTEKQVKKILDAYKNLRTSGVADNELKIVKKKFRSQLSLDELKNYIWKNIRFIADVYFRVRLRQFKNQALDTLMAESATLLDKREVEEIVLDPTERDLSPAVDNYMKIHSGGLLFAGGLLDFLDPIITEASRKSNIQVVVLTHQSGNSGRLVSECVDNRLRSDSYLNLYYLE